MTDTLGLPAMTGSSPDQSLVASLPPNATPAQQEQAAMAAYNADPNLQAYIKQTYGYIGAYLLGVPELLPILVAAGLENWDQNRFDGAVSQTNWWKNTSQAARNFQQLKSSDPASAQTQVNQMKNQILEVSQSLGVPVSATDLTQLASFGAMYNFTTTDIEQALRKMAQPNASPTFGATATFAADARALAGQYGIKLSDDQLGKYVQQNAAGTLTADGLQNTFEKQAAALYPWMKDSLAEGVTPSQFLSSYASAAASTLEIDQADVDWSDPKWTKALLTENGQTTSQPVNIGQFQQNLMKDPSYGYQNTKGARDNAYAMADQIASTFGKVKTQ